MNANDFEKTLIDLGIFCKCVDVQETPNTHILHFNILNLKDITRLKKTCEMMSARLHATIEPSTSDIGDFALVVIKKKRDFVDWCNAYSQAQAKPFEAVIGQDDTGNILKLDIRDMVSALCVGTSGSGKSTFIHSFINSLCCSSKNVAFVMIDCKRSELTRYNEKCSHLMCRVCTEIGEANTRLQQVINIMQDRYKIMEERKINKCPDDFHHIIIIVDELAELMLSSNKKQAEKTKNMLIRLCQLGRACGIHCLLCTQTPRVAVVDGMIQANTPTKFALRTSSTRESVIALGHGGCERLLGCGDMIYKSANAVKEHRLQTPYISSETIDKVFEPLPVRQWNTTPTKRQKKESKFMSWLKRLSVNVGDKLGLINKYEITEDDCIDYDIIDD